MAPSKGADPQQPLTTRAVRSGAWLYGRNILTSLINLGVMAILARQLTPADFGLVALATVLLRFIVILSEGGISEYIISDHREGHTNRAQAAFWMNLTFSCAVLLLGLLALPWVVRFYDEPGLRAILILLGIRYLFAQFSIAPFALLKKELHYNKIVVIDSVVEIASSLLSVVMALSGWGVLSLAVPGVLIEPLRSAWLMRVARWTPRLPLRTSEWKDVFRYSASMIVNALATAIGAEGDTLIIGKTLGSQSLGLYNLAWTSANMVHRNLIAPVSNVALPTLSSIAQNQEQLREGLHRMVRYLSAVSFPLLVGLFVIADLFILTIYGPQWTEAITPLRILIIYALRYAIGSPANSIFYSVGRPDIPMKFNLIFVPIYLVFVLAGSIYGIIGVAVGVTVVRTGIGLVVLGVASRQAGSTLSAILRHTFPALLASLCMGFVVAMARIGLEPFNLPNLLEMLLLVGTGGLTYLMLLAWVFRDLYKNMLVLVEALSPQLGRPMRWLISNRS